MAMGIYTGAWLALVVCAFYFPALVSLVWSASFLASQWFLGQYLLRLRHIPPDSPILEIPCSGKIILVEAQSGCRGCFERRLQAWWAKLKRAIGASCWLLRRSNDWASFKRTYTMHSRLLNATVQLATTSAYVFADGRIALGLAARYGHRCESYFLGLEPWLLPLGPFLDSAADHELIHVQQDVLGNVLNIACRGEGYRTRMERFPLELEAMLCGSPLWLSLFAPVAVAGAFLVIEVIHLVKTLI